MTQEIFKGQYVAYAVWTVSSILFFYFIFEDWMKPWMKITAGLVQLASVAFFTYGLYKAQHNKFWICLIAFCVDLIFTILILSWTLSE